MPRNEAPPPIPDPRRPTSLTENVRDGKRSVARTQRELDRDRARVEAEGKALEAQVKQLIRAGREKEARVLAKQLVANRNMQDKLVTARAQIGGLSYQMTDMHAMSKVGEAMGKANEAMASMNASAGVKSMMENAKMYEKESEKMNMAGEMMGDAIDGVLGGDEVDTAAEDVLSEVLDGIGMEYKSKMGAVPSARTKAQPSTHKEADAQLDDLLSRLERLG